MPMPGVKVGPLDPDATAEFGQVSQRNSARTLIRLHSQQHPPALRQRLSRPLDPERTKGLEMDEVRGYLSGLKHDNGDPLVPDGARVVGASVRGEPDTGQVLTFTYRKDKSGRSGKWFADYSASALPDSYDAGAELSRVKEMKDRGVVEFDREGLHTQVLQRENAGLRREAEALRKRLEAGDGGDLPSETEGDTRADNAIAAENEQLGRENEELRDRVQALETHFKLAGQEPPASREPYDPDRAHAVATEEPPLEDYDGMRADELAKLLRSDDTDDETRQAVLDYERTHSNRKSVIAAGEESLGLGKGS